MEISTIDATMSQFNEQINRKGFETVPTGSVEGYRISDSSVSKDST